MFVLHADFNAKHLVQFSVYLPILLTTFLLFYVFWNILLHHSDTRKTKYNLRRYCKTVEALEYGLYWYRKLLLKDHSALFFSKNPTLECSLLLRLLVSKMTGKLCATKNKISSAKMKNKLQYIKIYNRLLRTYIFQIYKYPTNKNLSLQLQLNKIKTNCWL